MNNFLGKDNYVWWVGVVENNNDPLQLGRCQVRIFGWHSENKQDIPTADLPWAQASFSPSSSNKWSVPNYGEYVTGFFGDGLSAQMPVMTGVMPGIFRSSGGDKGFQDVRTDDQKAAGPQMPAGQVRYVVGQPTTPPLARGIVANTAISQTNSQLSHVCDFANDVSKNNALKKFLMAEAKTIRDAIRLVLKSLGLTDPNGEFTALTAWLKSLARELKWIQKNIVQPIIDFEKYVLGYIATAQEIIKWILSLPARLLAILADCLQKMLKAIGNIFSDVLSSGGGSSDVFGTAKEVVQAGTNLAKSATTAIILAQSTAVAAQQTVQQAQQIGNVPQQLSGSLSNLGTIATATTIGTMTSAVSSIASSYPSANSAVSSAQASSQPKSTP